jgi:hypothetical protein
VNVQPQNADALNRVAERLTARGLRPLVDRDMEVIVCECPDCRGGETDPWGFWRPLKITIAGHTTTFECAGCGAVVVRDA